MSERNSKIMGNKILKHTKTIQKYSICTILKKFKNSPKNSNAIFVV
jgi:hypothetical protein